MMLVRFQLLALFIYMKIIKASNDKLYLIVHVYSGGLPDNLTKDIAKNQWSCDTILKGPDGIYMCREIIDAEFEDI